MEASVASNEELGELQELVKAFLARRAPIKETRRWMETAEGFDASVWAELAEQIGLQGITIPEAQGGLGLSVVEQGVALEELGAALYPGPFLSSAVLATNILLQSDDLDSMDRWLPLLASGEKRATAALAERSWEQGVERPAVQALALGNQWTLTGTKNLVVDGGTANLMTVSASTSDGPSLFLVEDDAGGLSRTALPVVDLTRKLATVTFEATPARLIGREGHAGPILRRAIDLSIAVLACEQVGAAARALEITIDYLKVREVFGRPLAAFQALKHRCADMLAQIETSRALASAALYAGAGGRWDELETLAALAKTRSWDTLDDVTAQAIQLHGGVGFTWEFDPHLYFKRARGNQFLFGDPTQYRERAAINLGM